MSIVETQTGAAIAVRQVRKSYGPGHALALEGISLDVRPGEFICMVGASGCGKTTLLNLIAGLDRPSDGTVAVAGKTGLLFQESALFPWLTVQANIELALRLIGVPKARRAERARELIALVRLTGSEHRRPHQLSGGMRQRAALARALAQDADILLMDEPFGALDAITRDLLHDELERVWADTGLTVLFVTHNVREAVRLGDRVLVLSSRPGRVVEEFAVPLARPRRMDSAEVVTLAGTVTERLRQEVRRHAG
ncbi:MAG TPA: ABC transporter ATP-binding protein [Egibacteraceae bacterium]|nr:ABC transporter ATP-binding protein [Egibacteraceae bacterium]